METSQEVNLLMDTVRRFVETEMFPHEEEIDRLGHVPEEIGRAIEVKSKELCLFACNLPEEVGGGGLGYGPMSLIEREYGFGVTTSLFGSISSSLLYSMYDSIKSLVKTLPSSKYSWFASKLLIASSRVAGTSFTLACSSAGRS
mgnify:CR=1 FL=1